MAAGAFIGRYSLGILPRVGFLAWKHRIWTAKYEPRCSPNMRRTVGPLACEPQLVADSSANRNRSREIQNGNPGQIPPKLAEKSNLEWWR